LPTTITIAPARAADIGQVQRLADVIWRSHYPGIITIEQIDYMLARGYSTEALSAFLDTIGSGIALALVDREPVGFVAWYRAGEPSTTKLDKLYVLQERHGRGIGRRLIEHVERRAREDGSTMLILQVNKDNAGSIAAYRKCGFDIREAVRVDIGGGFVMDDYVMGKAL
jgi:GNAT superfamily N-acetyltransferase